MTVTATKAVTRMATTAEPADPTRHPGGAPRDPNVPTTSGVCPKHGTVEFRVHRIGYDDLGRQRFRTRCPHCHADEMYASRHSQDIPIRTVVATDGSHNGREAGFAYVIDEHRYDYGPLASGVHTELVAVRRALAAIPDPVTIVLDHDEIYERLALGIAPKSRNAHRGAFLATREQVVARDVEFVLRNGDTGPATHALAHYLAFLGRRGHTPQTGRSAPAAVDILGAEEPYDVAARLVREHLFPATKEH